MEKMSVIGKLKSSDVARKKISPASFLLKFQTFEKLNVHYIYAKES